MLLNIRRIPGFQRRRWQPHTDMTSSSSASDVTVSVLGVSDCLSACEEREVMPQCVAVRYVTASKSCTLVDRYASQLTAATGQHYFELLDGRKAYLHSQYLSMTMLLNAIHECLCSRQTGNFNSSFQLRKRSPIHSSEQHHCRYFIQCYELRLKGKF